MNDSDDPSSPENPGSVEFLAQEMPEEIPVEVRCDDGRLHPKNALRNHGGLYVTMEKHHFLTGDASLNCCFSIVKCSFSWAYTGCEDGMMGLVFRKTKLIQRFQISHGIVEVGTFLANSPKTWTGNVGFILSNFL